MQSGGFDVERPGGHTIKGLGENGRKVRVFRIDADTSCLEARSPQLGGGLIVFRGATDLEGEVDSQACQGSLPVLLLASSFGGLGRDAGRFVDQANRGFNFVPMLSARPATAQAFCSALAVELLRFGCRGMRSGVGHRRIRAQREWEDKPDRNVRAGLEKGARGCYHISCPFVISPLGMPETRLQTITH